MSFHISVDPLGGSPHEVLLAVLNAAGGDVLITDGDWQHIKAGGFRIVSTRDLENRGWRIAIETTKPRFFRCSGALMCDREIEGVTQPVLDPSSQDYYGGQWMICEAIALSACQAIAESLGGVWEGEHCAKQTD